jgi:hypothetical protein
MESTVRTLLFADAGFGLVAATTWFFSSRPRLFIRCFVPADEFRAFARSILRNENYQRGMRFIAVLQRAVAGVLTIATLVAWLAALNGSG